MADSQTTTEQPPRGKIVASCGHEVPGVGGLIDVRYGDTDCDHDGFHRVVIYGSWCKPCADKWRASGDLIETDEQETEWLNGKP